MPSHTVQSGDPAHRPQLEQVSRSGFAEFIGSRKRVIVALGSHSAHSFLLPVAHCFARWYGGTIRFGYLHLDSLSERAWALPFVRPVLCTCGRTPRAAKSGYYLFIDGRAVGFHLGMNDPRLGPLPFSTADETSRPSERTPEAFRRFAMEAARAVVGHFEPLLNPRRRSSKLRVNAYAILGVTPGSTDEEIKTAYRAKLRVSHPDLLRSDPELAHEQTQLLNRAYAAIKAERREQRSGVPGRTR